MSAKRLSSFLTRVRFASRAAVEAFRESEQSLGDRAEHPLLVEPRQFIRRPAAAWLIAFGGTAIGVWLALRVDEIKQATQQALHNMWALEWGPPAWWEIFFWLGCVVWAWLLMVRLKDDDQVVLARTRSLLHAIHKTANLRVVKDYARRFFYPILNELGPFVPDPLPDSAGKVAERIRNALGQVARFAQEFANIPAASYGANVMLVAGPDDFEALRATLRFVVDKRDTSSLRAVLYLPEPLVVRNIEPAKQRTYPLIALPVPDRIKTERGNRLALPGAASALLGEPSVHMDTRTMAEDCRDLARDVVEEIRDYFGEHGGGKDVRSFASFRLGTGKNPVGVLNIDSDRVCVLGESDEYYITFFALLEPFLAALALQVQEYARLAGRPKAPAS